MNREDGSIIAGLAIGWLLNLAQVGIGWLMLVADNRMLPGVFVLVGMMGLVQVGYVVPIWRLLRRRGRQRTAKGLLIAAGTTLVGNVIVWIVLWVMTADFMRISQFSIAESWPAS